MSPSAPSHCSNKKPPSHACHSILLSQHSAHFCNNAHQGCLAKNNQVKGWLPKVDTACVSWGEGVSGGTTTHGTGWTSWCGWWFPKSVLSSKSPWVRHSAGGPKAAHHLQTTTIQIQVYPSSSSPLLENQREQSKRQSSMHRATAGFYQQTMVCPVLLQREVACHATSFKQHECCCSEIISAMLEAASHIGKNPSDQYMTGSAPNISAHQRGSRTAPPRPTAESCPAEWEACGLRSKNAGNAYKVRHISTVTASEVSVKLALLVPRSEGYESNAHRWSATFHNETRLYCPEEAAFHNLSIEAYFFFYIFYFLCKLWAVLPLSLNQKLWTIKTCFITESWPSICVQWTSFSSLDCWHKHSQPKPEKKLEQTRGSEYSETWGEFSL